MSKPDEKPKAGRPDLFCRYCHYVWKPIGSNTSKKCPKCGAKDFAPTREHRNTLDKFFED